MVTSRITLSVLEDIAVETLTSLPHKNSMLTDIEYRIIAEDGVAYIDSDLARKGRSNLSALKLRSLELARQGSAGYIEEMNVRRQTPVIKGVGFQMKRTRVPTREGGFRLFNLHEQIRSIGGHIRVSSVPGRGSRVMMVFPLRTLTIAVELAASIHPDVILMDVNLPKVNGVEATQLIKQRFPDIVVIGLSMHEDPKLEQLMYEAGASPTCRRARRLIPSAIQSARYGTAIARRKTIP